MKTDLDSYLFGEVLSNLLRKEEGNTKTMTTNEWDDRKGRRRKSEKRKINKQGEQTKTMMSTRSEKI